MAEVFYSSDVWFILFTALLFAIITGRPNRKLGPLDEKVDKRGRWAYFFYSFFLAQVAFTFVTYLWRTEHTTWALITLVLVVPVAAALQAAYYIFLALDSSEKDS